MVAHLFDERDGAVEKMVEMAIAAAHRAGKKIGICGQAPSDYPEFARFLVEKGIHSMSLNPDTVIQTTQLILEAESATPPLDLSVLAKNGDGHRKTDLDKPSVMLEAGPLSVSTA
jgi:pyruvate,water dikinase